MAGPLKKHVLVADDEKHTRVALSLILKRAGFEVTTAEDGTEALSMLVESTRGSRRFDLLVLDIQMPGLTGIELVEEIGRLEAAFPILLITGYREKERVADLMYRQCIEYAEKPFDPTELLAHVERVIDRFERERCRPPASPKDRTGAGKDIIRESSAGERAQKAEDGNCELHARECECLDGVMTAEPTRYLPLEQTEASWYEEIGLKAGLEVHQQLLTRKKLFCRCPAGIYSREWDAEILRHMRPTLSELGEYDGTALMEFKTRKQVLYRINKETVCTYEFDDTPPFKINEEALDAAIEIALLLNMNMVSEIHISRKQYLDGSIPTGFQRTTILGMDGWIPYGGHRIRIRQLGLEEDACREVSDVGHVRTYITDRLGMPLVETVTYPDMTTPRGVAGVAEVIRRLNRATGRVRTGAGAARQDVNVSVRGGCRCEIKGVSSIKRIARLVHNEAFRQLALLEIRDELRRRGVDEANLFSKCVEITDKAAGMRFRPILTAVHKGWKVHAVQLGGFAGLLRHSIGPGRNFLQEFSDRIRVVACIDSLPNVLASDLPEGNLSTEDWQLMHRAAGARQGDAVVVVWGPEEDIQTACNEIVIRAREACAGVPEETRQAMPDGTTGFERILPGPNRMYPDTDLPPMALDDRRVENIRSRLPETPWSRKERYRAAGIPEQLAQRLSISPHAHAFDNLGDAVKSNPVLAASLVADHLRRLQRKGADANLLDVSFLLRLFQLLEKGLLVPDGVVLMFAYHLHTGCCTVDEIIGRLGLTPASSREIGSAIDGVLEHLDVSKFSSPGAARRFAMGRIMDSLRGRVRGAEVSRLLEQRIGPGGTT